MLLNNTSLDRTAYLCDGDRRSPQIKGLQGVKKWFDGRIIKAFD